MAHLARYPFATNCSAAAEVSMSKISYSDGEWRICMVHLFSLGVTASTTALSVFLTASMAAALYMVLWSDGCNCTASWKIALENKISTFAVICFSYEWL